MTDTISPEKVCINCVSHIDSNFYNCWYEEINIVKLIP